MGLAKVTYSGSTCLRTGNAPHKHKPVRVSEHRTGCDRTGAPKKAPTAGALPAIALLPNVGSGVNLGEKENRAQALRPI